MQGRDTRAQGPLNTDACVEKSSGKAFDDRRDAADQSPQKPHLDSLAIYNGSKDISFAPAVEHFSI